MRQEHGSTERSCTLQASTDGRYGRIESPACRILAIYQENGRFMWREEASGRRHQERQRRQGCGSIGVSGTPPWKERHETSVGLSEETALPHISEFTFSIVFSRF